MLEYQLHNLTGGTKRTKELYRRGLEKALEVMNGDEFKEAVHNYEWRDSNGILRKNFKLNKNELGEHSRGELYNLLMSGWDKFDKSRDGDIDVDATIYYKRWSGVKGYTYGNTRKTWSNTKFWTGPSEQEIIAGIAANIIHEYMHNMGFGHAFDWNPTREFTVPYAIGTIIYNIIMDQDLGPMQSDMVYVCRRVWYKLWIGKSCKWQRK